MRSSNDMLHTLPALKKLHLRLKEINNLLQLNPVSEVSQEESMLRSHIT